MIKEYPRQVATLKEWRAYMPKKVAPTYGGRTVIHRNIRRGNLRFITAKDVPDFFVSLLINGHEFTAPFGIAVPDESIRSAISVKREEFEQWDH